MSSTEKFSYEDLVEVLKSIHDEAAAAGVFGTQEANEKALSNIVSMARYHFDATPEADRVRNRKLPS